MPHGPLSLRTHALMEPIAAIVLIVGPWLFGFDDIESCTIVSVVVGAVMLVAGMVTRWRYSLLKLLTLRSHLATDIILGVVLIVAPFLAGASDRGDATRFLVIMGALELVTALSTNWDQREQFAVRRDTRGGAAAAR
jgi:predicted cobalt transporter CbtA